MRRPVPAALARTIPALPAARPGGMRSGVPEAMRW